MIEDEREIVSVTKKMRQLQAKAKKIRLKRAEIENEDDTLRRELYNVEREIDNLATDLWGGAGPDCMFVLGRA